MAAKKSVVKESTGRAGTARAGAPPAKKAAAKKPAARSRAGTGGKPAAKQAPSRPSPATLSAARASGKSREAGTRDNPWTLTTPSGSAEYQAFRDPALDPPALVVRVGKTELRYHLRAIEDLHALLKKHGDWMVLGSADEQKDAAEGTVEAWGRSEKNPVKGWYGLKMGLRGRFGMYVPPVLEELGLAEVEHNPKNNRMRAL